MDQSNSTAGSGSPGGMTPADVLAAEMAAYYAAIKAELISQPLNENAAKYLGGVVGFMMLLFVVSHWTRVVARRSKGAHKVPVLAEGSRAFRKLMIRPVPGFTSITVGHATLILSYWVTIAAITFTNIDWSDLNSLGKRFGWMAVTNIAIITFLAMKNTPLSFLAGYSYERINILHQVAGYTTVVLAFLHMILQLKYFADIQALTVILQPAVDNANVTASSTAAVAFFILLVSALLIKRFHYEVFYLTHISMYVVIVVGVGLHRPDITTKSLIIVIVAGSIFSADRLTRAAKLLWYSFYNQATVYPLEGSTRVVLRRMPSRAVSGSHCFLWVPKIRAFQAHPFTITSVESLELVVSARDGFTRDLHNFALKYPGTSIRASIDGPYGSLPNFASFDKVILVAGGSGASFTFGIAVDLVKKIGTSKEGMIEFIWSIKNREHLAWFSEKLDILQKSPMVKLTIHSTGSSSSDSASSLLTPITKVTINTKENSASGSEKMDSDVEKQEVAIASPAASINTISGRPNVDHLIREIVAQADKNDRIAIAVCGPAGMLTTARSTAAECITTSGPSVEFYGEHFGW